MAASRKSVARRKQIAKAVAAVGRPTLLTPEVRETLIALLRSGQHLVKACKQLKIDRGNVYYTASQDEDFRTLVQEARAEGVDGLVDEAIDVSMDAAKGHKDKVPGRKLYVGQLNWVAERLAPNRWGPKSSMAITVSHGVDDAQAAKRLRFLQTLQAPTIDAEAVEVDDAYDGSDFA